jgi:retron-type reverse transcriptase
LLRSKLKCPDTLWLINTIIDGSNEQDRVIDYFPGDDLLTPTQRRKGLPIGNLTSQFFANIYLSGLDHFIKEQLQIKKYLRYVDDFALFGDDRQQLADARLAIAAYLTTLRLKIHPIKSQLFETRYGANFVGFRILPDRIRVRNDNLRRARHRMKQLQQAYAEGQLTSKSLMQHLQSWEAHLLHGDTQSLRRDIFGYYVFSRSSQPSEGVA